MVYRIYVEKKPGFDGEAQSLRNELVSLLGIKELNGLRLLNRYDVEGIDEALFEQCVPTVFSEPPVDNTYAELPISDGVSFAVEYLPGQFDQRADSAAECIQLISQGDRPLVRSARVYLLEGTLTDEQVAEIKKYVINPVEAREASLDTRATLKMKYPVPTEVEVLDGFNELNEAGLKKFIDEKGLAMDLGDIKFCQEYFRSEKRDPTITEIKMIDTYWSDHCRHTTFGTILDDVQIDDAVVQEAFDRYMAMRADLGRENKPRCMMDLATIGAKELKKQGILKNLDESEEINACTVKIKCDVNGKDEDWLFLFKNETHNHPTEIEPFGGAATCIGGAEVSDPLLCHSRIGQICLVHHIELWLAGRNALHLGVQAGKRDAGIQQHQTGIHMLDLRLHHPQGLGHVAGEPLDVILICKAGIVVHFTTPKSEKGKKQSSTLPRISRSSMQPT